MQGFSNQQGKEGVYEGSQLHQAATITEVFQLLQYETESRMPIATLSQ